MRPPEQVLDGLTVPWVVGDVGHRAQSPDRALRRLHALGVRHGGNRGRVLAAVERSNLQEALFDAFLGSNAPPDSCDSLGCGGSIEACFLGPKHGAGSVLVRPSWQESPRIEHPDASLTRSSLHLTRSHRVWLHGNVQRSALELFVEPYGTLPYPYGSTP